MRYVRRLCTKEGRNVFKRRVYHPEMTNLFCGSKDEHGVRCSAFFLYIGKTNLFGLVRRRTL